MSQGEFVFPAPDGDTPLTNFARVWRWVVHRLGGLPTDVTPHALPLRIEVRPSNAA